MIKPAPDTRRWEPQTVEQKLAWMIILATIPVGIAGLALEHAFRVYFSKPVLTALFLACNGVILLYGERLRRQRIGLSEQQAAEDRQLAAVGGPPVAPARSAGQRALKEHEAELAVRSDRRLTGWAGWTRSALAPCRSSRSCRGSAGTAS